MKTIVEGKFDQYTFKAVFIIGGPASGKTEFYNYALKNKNLKHLDSDKIMAFLIKKYGGSLQDTNNYSKWESEIKNKLNMMSTMYKEGGLGLAIDGTGKNIQNIINLKRDVEKYGYKTAMIYIKTSLQDSIEKSKKRDRAVDLEYIKDTYRDLSKNVSEYRKMFDVFIEVNSIEEYKKAEKKINSWLNK